MLEGRKKGFNSIKKKHGMVIIKLLASFEKVEMSLKVRTGPERKTNRKSDPLEGEREGKGSAIILGVKKSKRAELQKQTKKEAKRLPTS